VTACRLAPALLALTALVTLGARVQAREVWQRGDASLAITGSVKEIGLAASGTDASRFAAASASSPLCLFAATFARCPALDLVNATVFGQSLTRLRMRIDARATSWLSAVVG
jgi:hypothetical protein